MNNDGEELEEEWFEQMAFKILERAETKKPCLEAFDGKIKSMSILKKEINEMKPIVDIGLLKVNSIPLIKEL